MTAGPTLSTDQDDASVSSVVSFDRGDDDSSSSSSSSSSLSSTTTLDIGNTTEEGEGQEPPTVTNNQEEITKNETRNVSRLRQIVVVMLIVKAVVVCWIVFAVQRSRQTTEFENHYESASDKILESYEGIVEKMGAIGGLGVQMTSHSIEEQVQFPFVSLPHFHLRSQNARDLSGALAVSVDHGVRPQQFQEWDDFVNNPDNNAWIEDLYEMQDDTMGIHDFEDDTHDQERRIDPNRTVDVMHYFKFKRDGSRVPVAENGITEPFYLPRWQASPLLRHDNRVNGNSFRQQEARSAFYDLLQFKTAVVGGFLIGKPGTSSSSHPVTAILAFLMSAKQMKNVPYAGDPISQMHFPVFDSFDVSTRKVVAMMTAFIHWGSYFRNLLPDTCTGVYVVLENSCGSERTPTQYTYMVHGPHVHSVGIGDHHQPQFDAYKREGFFGSDVVIQDGTVNGVYVNNSYCGHKMRVYPSQEFHGDLITSGPLKFTVAIGGLYVIVIIIFLLYDWLVERRQQKVLEKATKSTAIISSLFPKTVRDKLMESESSHRDHYAFGIKSRLTNILKGDAGQEFNPKGSPEEPIAELFPECTVFFADIVGFTAWSSAREPCQVFVLLQALYQAFDEIARRRRVFKVETIGDSYVAVTGLPEPQKFHAVVMIRFAMECLERMHSVTRKLECSLGPDTSMLTMRMGANSGPVTAGVLRGERARFQLFGDTVNTASRMESTGCEGRIQVSEATAALLREAGKGSWIEPRSELVHAKGKGKIQTYFVTINGYCSGSTHCGSTVSSECSKLSGQDMSLDLSNHLRNMGSASHRLINWITELLVSNIQRIVQHRRKCGVRDDETSDFVYNLPSGRNCMDEVLEVIEMPTFNAFTVKEDSASETIQVEMTPKQKELVKLLVAEIATLYESTNHFHGFEHACHVTMSVVKLLNRVIAPDISPGEVKDRADLALHLHSFTHGIHSDPLLHFAMTFSALIHDVNHRGVSNAQMAVEEPGLAERYNHKSIAEQNSLDLAWQVLMQERFIDLRRFIFGTQEDLLRFRQLVVNVVLATDIFDKELNDLRKARWKKAFTVQPVQRLLQDYSSSRTVASVASLGGSYSKSDVRATVVIEHIIQASDVAHCMQHWHVYQKWNKKLLMEMHSAYKAGRMGKDPFSFWYQGEIGFFDNYIIPLAKKLKECGVFGVSGDEYYNYAVENRAEWSLRGKDILEGVKKRLAEAEESRAATSTDESTLASNNKTYYA